MDFFLISLDFNKEYFISEFFAIICVIIISIYIGDFSNITGRDLKKIKLEQKLEELKENMEIYYKNYKNKDFLCEGDDLTELKQIFKEMNHIIEEFETTENKK